MAQTTSSGRGRVVREGDYLVGRQIGSGSFSVVWHARHRVHGTEVAIKEIVTGRLNKKLQDSLMSEIFILKRINHPNIIRLHDIIEKPGKIHIVLEYCKGGDLSMYIQRHGRVAEATAKHFMQQLAAGLQVLRENNLIHRDLKPQNLLLSTSNNNSVLKIADFGFARSLQPRGLAETLCGSPLYMAPEIMQLQKYDAKADLWSVGAILFQLVTAKTPYSGSNQMQLLQNITKSTGLHFPPDTQDLSSNCKDLCEKLLRRNPVERLTFEEFFNHQFVSERQTDELLRNRRPSRVYELSSPECDAVKNALESSSEDYLPFPIDDSSGPEGSTSSLRRKPSMKSFYGSSQNSETYPRECTSNASNTDIASRCGTATSRVENTSFLLEGGRSLDGNSKEPPKFMDHKSQNLQSNVVDSMESIDQDYVLVSEPSMDVSVSSASAPRQGHSQCKGMSPPLTSVYLNATSSVPMPIIGAATSNPGYIGSLESQSSAPGTLQETTDSLEHPSTDCLTRIKSLQLCAATITELVNEKIEAGQHLEAFSIQLVILAIWKQALHICHTQAASAMEGSPTQETMKLRRNTSSRHGSLGLQVHRDASNTEESGDILLQIEREFLLEVEHAEELVKVVEPGSTEMPDAMETIFQSALALGRNGAVDELMGDLERAAELYSKAVRLLAFLLVEAPSLILNPPFTLTTSDRYRLQTYIDILSGRLGHSRSQRLALVKE